MQAKIFSDRLYVFGCCTQACNSMGCISGKKVNYKKGEGRYDENCDGKSGYLFTKSFKHFEKQTLLLFVLFYVPFSAFSFSIFAVKPIHNRSPVAFIRQASSSSDKLSCS